MAKSLVHYHLYLILMLGAAVDPSDRSFSYADGILKHGRLFLFLFVEVYQECKVQDFLCQYMRG